MSQITCCPACGTMFKVVADQLRVSEGWVRCGHCAEVFDASANMQPVAGHSPSVAPPPPAAAPVPAVPVAPSHVVAAGHPAREAPSEPSMEQGWQPSGADLPVADPRPGSAAAAPVPAVDDGPGYPPFELRRPDVGEVGDADAQPAPPEVVAPPGRREEPESEPPLDDVSFVRQARRKAFWRRPLVRLLLVLLVLVLAALLGLQFLVQERDRVAALQPQLRPLLQTVCARLACSIGPLRRIDAIAIDSSGFNKLRPDLYRLSFTLKNQGAPAVAVPALELTLTDAQDQAVLRRVLAPRELGATSPVIPGGGEWSGSVPLVVQANGVGARVAGYRLLAFYP